DVYRSGTQFTRYLSQFDFKPLTIDVLQPGTQSTIQDWPGRSGYWNIGVPPSGPMDKLAFRFANRIVGNPEGMAALELTVTGPTLKFNTDTLIALTGAHMKAELDGVAIAYWQPIVARAGSVLKLRGIQGAGNRTYIAVQGGFDVPLYMGSAATFTLGQFGGHGGRPLRVGDVLRLNSNTTNIATCKALPAELIPAYGTHWNIAVMYGPHGAPDFFTDHDIKTFFSNPWEVNYNSSRTGVRLIGPKPQWARSDGGEAGLHPSNIHDNAYAIGTIDFTGDMPVILGPDGPSLGGFVCPATIVQAELWKMGQLKPGDTISFHCIAYDEAQQRATQQDQAVHTLTVQPQVTTQPLTAGVSATPILYRNDAQGDRPAVCYRQSGDAYLLVEYGQLMLDLDLRFRVHALMQWIEQHQVPGIVDLTPGIRSLQIHYSNDGKISQQ
ncbi:MAG TPA: 5-oxoprolinase/urea amidolyase family protein, partial [Gammaproteobacteria bacterium]|nr:5-oxoprolinase/urea amidolyase family protein [Gammaproteobacteria bacterium]